MIKKAFSLIELSVALLIIGVIVVAIISTNLIISKAQVKTAASLTTSSEVPSIKGLELWIETTMEKSFVPLNSSVNDSVSEWVNINPQSSIEINVLQSDSSKQPIISNSYNRINSLAFDGTNSQMEVDLSFLNNKDYTIFAVTKRLSSKSNNYFIGDNSNTTENEELILGYATDDTILHSQSGDNYYDSNIQTYSENNLTQITAFTQSKVNGKKTYINGILSGNSSNKDQLENIGIVKIGNNFLGEIGEIIIFSRALNNEDRKSIESYLSKKWNVNIYQDNSCLVGIVSSSGCYTNTCSVSLTGSTTSVVSNGSGNIACDASGYSGTVPYTCDGGSLSLSESCSCGIGYSSSGGSCLAITCSFSSYEGINDVSGLAYSSDEVTKSCDASGYTGSVNYTCTSSGAATVESGSCNPPAPAYFTESSPSLDNWPDTGTASEEAIAGWFADNNCITSSSEVIPSPSSFAFSNGSLLDDTWWHIWVVSASGSSATYYYKNGSWNSMSLWPHKNYFGAGIGIIGCSRAP